MTSIYVIECDRCRAIFKLDEIKSQIGDYGCCPKCTNVMVSLRRVDSLRPATFSPRNIADIR